MGLEAPACAQLSSDWHRPARICALSGTLIWTRTVILHPAHFNDRLLLGLKGTIERAELHVLRARIARRLHGQKRAEV